MNGLAGCPTSWAKPYRLRVVFALFVAAFIALLNSTSAAKADSMPVPKVIIFDVNETLLDFASQRHSAGKSLPRYAIAHWELMPEVIHNTDQ